MKTRIIAEVANFGRNRRARVQREMSQFDALPRPVRDQLNYGNRQPSARDVSRMPGLIRSHGVDALVRRIRELDAQP